MTFIPSSTIRGTQDSGDTKDIPVTQEGHLEVAIHSPRLPFGSIHSEEMTPEFQTDSVYGINTSEINAVTGSSTGGSVSSSNTGTSNLLKSSTGTTAYSFATIQSRKRLRYRAGQGTIVRFSMMFSTPAASSILVAGCGTGESGFFFGYNGTTFGILHSTGGVREIQTLTVTTASTATNNYVVTLGGTAFSVTATNNGSTTKTAYEIAQGTYTGWKAEQRGSTVIFLADSVGNKTGTFSLAQTGAGTPAAGSFVETVAGVASTDTWTSQANWNGDKLNGTGASGFTLNPQKGNVGQIDIQFGFGPVVFKVGIPSSSGNDYDYVIAHTMNFPNTLTGVSVTQPSFPFTMAAYSAGSTTDVWVACGSFSGFIEGEKKLTGPRMTFNRETNNFIGSTAATYYPFFTIRNDYIHGHSITERANQSVVNLKSISCSHDDTTPVAFFLIRNATLAGTPNFTKFSTVSCIYWDTAATTCTITNNEQLIFSLNTGQASGETVIFSDEITLQPGETLTLAGRAAEGTPGTVPYANASLNTREDQ